MPTIHEIDTARRWLNEHCHRSELRPVLERGLDYVEAVARAGLCTDSTCGDDLYNFLSDPAAAAARTRTLFEPTM